MGRNDDAAPSGPDAMFDALVESRALWKEFCETIADLVFETDHQGRFTFLWPPDCLGWSADELIGRPSTTLLVQAPAARGTMFDPFHVRAPCRLSHAWLRRGDGETAVMAISARPTSRGGTRGVAVDITEADAAARASSIAIRVRRTVDRILAVAEHEALPTPFLQAVLGAALRAFGADGAALFKPGLRDGTDAIETLQVVGTGWDLVSGFDDVASPDTEDAGPGPADATLMSRQGQAVLRASVGDRPGDPASIAIWRRGDGAAWSSLDRQVAASLAAALRHVIEVDSLQHALVRARHADLLTGLLDRRAFFSEVARRFGRLDGDRLSGTMLSIDLDDFRSVNERHGLEGGDRALRRLAGLLRDAVRPTDLVARIGGDEFAVWLDGADVFAAAERADALCRHGAFEGAAERGECRGWSIGLATRPPDGGETVESLMRRAAAAMLDAKSRGKKRWSASREEIGT